MAVGAEAPRAPAGVLYGRFTRRLRGVAIDFMLFLAAMVVALQIAVGLSSDYLARVIGFGFMAGFFLYEPLMVSIVGGTIGHYLSNLRVVDDQTHGNVSFLKALARVLIKTVLSWYSFISMAAAQRHQAVHDLLTRSTVQVRDPAKALPSHYSRERVELSTPGMPSRARRIAVIVLYLLGSVVLLALVTGGTHEVGALYSGMRSLRPLLGWRQAAGLRGRPHPADHVGRMHRPRLAGPALGRPHSRRGVTLAHFPPDVDRGEQEGAL